MAIEIIKNKPNLKKKKKIEDFMTSNNITLENVLDAVIHNNGLIGVGLIRLGDDLQKFCYNKIPKKAPTKWE